MLLEVEKTPPPTAFFNVFMDFNDFLFINLDCYLYTWFRSFSILYLWIWQSAETGIKELLKSKGYIHSELSKLIDIVMWFVDETNYATRNVETFKALKSWRQDLFFFYMENLYWYSFFSIFERKLFKNYCSLNDARPARKILLFHS